MLDGLLDQSVLIKALLGMGAGYVGLLLYIWRQMVQQTEQQHVATLQQNANIQKQLNDLHACMEHRFAEQQERRILIQERLASLEAGQRVLVDTLGMIRKDIRNDR